MKFKVFIGIDVSKETLDFTVLVKGAKLYYTREENNKAGIKAFHTSLKRLLNQLGFSLSDCLFCMEHTGIYCNPFLEFVQQRGLVLWLEDGNRIKSFYGISREKNDEVDSLMIAEYAYMKRNKVRLWEAPRPIIMKLKRLLACRERLVSGKTRLAVPLNEAKGLISTADLKEEKALIQPLIKQMEKKIKAIEKRIIELIKSDEDLHGLFKLICSVKGIGLIIGAHTLVVTNEFKLINEPKKMACHCGVAPFKKESGKTIRGKAKVSHRANKTMKKLLNLGARSAVGSRGELRDYYLRKISEGKNKMAVLNAVRNKLIHRMFACVRENRKYENFYQHSLA